MFRKNAMPFVVMVLTPDVAANVTALVDDVTVWFGESVKFP